MEIYLIADVFKLSFTARESLKNDVYACEQCKAQGELAVSNNQCFATGSGC